MRRDKSLITLSPTRGDCSPRIQAVTVLVSMAKRFSFFPFDDILRNISRNFRFERHVPDDAHEFFIIRS